MRASNSPLLQKWGGMVPASAATGGPRAANGLSMYAPPLGQLDPAYETQAIHRRWGLGAWGACLTAHHGSVSVVTFAVATAALARQGIAHEAHEARDASASVSGHRAKTVTHFAIEARSVV